MGTRCARSIDGPMMIISGRWEPIQYGPSGIISGQWESISIAPAVSSFFVRSAQQRGPALLIDHCVSWPQNSAAHSRGNVFQVYPALLKPGEVNISSYKHVSVCFRRALALRGVSFNASV